MRIEFASIAFTLTVNLIRFLQCASNAHRVNPPRNVDWKRIEPNRVGVPEVMNNE